MRPSLSERRRRPGRRGHPPLPGGWILLVAIIARVINGVEIPAAVISGAAMVGGPSRSGDDTVEGGNTAAVGVINVPTATDGDNPATATVVSGAAVVSHIQAVSPPAPLQEHALLGPDQTSAATTTGRARGLERHADATLRTYSRAVNTTRLRVTAGSDHCFIDADGCATNGPGNHRNVEACAVEVDTDGVLSVTGGDLSTGPARDHLTINRNRHQGLAGPSGAVAVAAGSTFTWRSDGFSSPSPGWTVCWSDGSGGCSAHSECGYIGVSHTYCTTTRSCHACNLCVNVENNDAIDGACPDACSEDTTGAGSAPGLSRSRRQTTLDWRNQDLTYLPPNISDGRGSLTTLKLNNNSLTSLELGVFDGLGELTTLLLNSNSLTSLELGVFDGLGELLILYLQDNRLTHLDSGIFDGLGKLRHLHLFFNRIGSVTNPDTLFGVPGVDGPAIPNLGSNLLFNPNPLVCRPTPTSVAPTGPETFICDSCSQGYLIDNTTATGIAHQEGSSHHVDCRRPAFQLDLDPDGPAQRTVEHLRASLSIQHGNTVYIGEDTGLYAGLGAEEHGFEPKRDKFFGYAAVGRGFDDITFRVKFGDVDVGCDSIIVGDLADTTEGGGAVPSRIVASDFFDTIFVGNQRLLRFEVIEDGYRFNFSSCNSPSEITLAVYNDTAGSSGSLRPYIVPSTANWNWQDPTSSGCPMGMSAALTDIVLDRGRYLLAVQGSHDDPVQTILGVRTYEVEMVCANASSAMPLDPSAGGIIINPVTGRLTVSPDEGATSGTYNLSLIAIDANGTSDTFLVEEIELRRRPELEVSATCGQGQKTRIKFDTSASQYFPSEATVVDGFACSRDDMFNLPGVSFRLDVDGNFTGLKFVDTDTGTISITPYDTDLDDTFNASLVAFTTAGATSSMVIASFVIAPESRPDLVIVNGTCATATQQRQAIISRATNYSYYVDEPVVIDGFACPRDDMFSLPGVLFRLDVDGNFTGLKFVDTDTGTIVITPYDTDLGDTFNASLVAFTTAGATSSMVIASWQITPQKRLGLKLTQDCGNIAKSRLREFINRESNSEGRYRHDLNAAEAVILPGFIHATGSCDTKATFNHYRSDGNGVPSISYNVRITTADGNDTDLGENTFINSQTGKMSFALAPELGVGNYTVELRATSGTGDPLLLHDWVMDLRENDTADDANGPNGRGCSGHGDAMDEVQQDDSFTCRCAARFTGDNCGSEIVSSIAYGDSAVIGGSLGVVVFLMLAALIAFRVQLYRVKHRAVDVSVVQLEVLLSLGLVASTNIAANEYGIAVIFDRALQIADGLSQEFKDDLVATLRKSVPAIKSALSTAKIITMTATATAAASKQVLVIMRKDVAGKAATVAETAVEQLLQKAGKSRITVGELGIVDANVALPHRVPREIARSALTRIKVLGEGAFGEVHQYQLEEKGSSMMSYFVAAKSIKAGAAGAEEARADLIREAALGALVDHRNVTSTIGICTTPRDVPALLLLAFCAEGSLEAHCAAATPESMTVCERLTYCAQVLQGLQYISARRIVHRDVAARNVLLDSTMVCKISDFGMAAALVEDGKEYIRSTEQLAVRWCSIEVAQEGKYSVQSDVWAFGVLAFEVFACGTLPYADRCANLTAVTHYIKEGGQLGRPNPAACPRTVYEELMLPCFAAEPADRPAFGALYEVAVKHGAAEDEIALQERATRRNVGASSRRASAVADRSLFGPSVHHLASALVPGTVAAILAIRKNKGHELQPAYDLLSDPTQASIWHMVHAYAKPCSAAVVCPRDGDMGCAYVDTLTAEDDVGPADGLLSYAWGYLVAEVSAALSAWADRAGRDPKRTRIWICSLCLNQHGFEARMLKAGGPAGPEALQQAFGERVVGIGRILPMLEPWDDPGYAKRAWCLFELYTAIQKRDEVDIDVILSPKQAKSFNDRINCDGTDARAIDAALGGIKSADAETSVPADTESIRSLIQSYAGGFGTLDDTVRQYLRRWFVSQGGVRVVARLSQVSRSSSGFSNQSRSGSASGSAGRAAFTPPLPSTHFYPARFSSQNAANPNHQYLKVMADGAISEASDEDTEFGFGAIEAEFG